MARRQVRIKPLSQRDEDGRTPVEIPDMACRWINIGPWITDNESQSLGLGRDDRIKIGMHFRGAQSLCGPRLIDAIILLFIAAGVASVIWKRFLLQDCVIEHRFVGGEESRECEVDGRCQGELYAVSGRIELSANSVVGIGKWSLTPSRYARSNRRAPTPTRTFVFMLLTSPGKVSGTDSIIAAAARQFCKRHKGQDPRPTFGNAHGSICISIPSMRPVH
jgi:hypothetical protein